MAVALLGMTAMACGDEDGEVSAVPGIPAVGPQPGMLAPAEPPVAVVVTPADDGGVAADGGGALPDANGCGGKKPRDAGVDRLPDLPPDLPPALCGYFTGGGSFFEGELRVTHGFELNCSLSEVPNNLEINWDGGNNFHLEALTSVRCSDDAALEPDPPPAGFDTMVASGTGSLNGVEGATIEFTLTDAGEPGVADFADVVIRDASGSIVLDADNFLTFGDQQAHDRACPE